MGAKQERAQIQNRAMDTGTDSDRTADTAGWLARNALHLAVALLVALFGWTRTRTLDGIASEVTATSLRIERLDEALRGVLVDQASQARRIEHGAAETARIERRLEHIESRLEARGPAR